VEGRRDVGRGLRTGLFVFLSLYFMNKQYYLKTKRNKPLHSRLERGEVAMAVWSYLGNHDSGKQREHGRERMG
jgi:hypothetical protein